MSPSPMRVDALGGVRVTKGGAHVRLSPFQAALTTVVFATGEISRPAIAALLWPGEFDSRARHRLRQLISETRRRAGEELFQTDRDFVRPSSTISSDVQELQAALSDARLEQAARLLTRGELAPSLNGLPDPFDDWCHGMWHGWSRSIESSARSAWPVHASDGAWELARDVAEAMVLLNRSDAQWASRLIEARGRNGQVRAAEVAYAEYCSGLSRREEPDRGVRDIIDIVRALPGAEPSTAHRSPQFVGRRAAIHALTPLFEDLRDNRPGFAVITGEAGIGKTRLLDELRRTAHLDGFRCLHARGVEFERIIALNPLIDALQTVDLEGHLTALGEPWRTVIGGLLPPGSLTDPVGELPSIQERNLPRRLFDAFSLLLDSIANEKPTVLFLDDLHWADSTTVSTLLFFQRRSTATPFGVIASIRPEAVRSNDPCRPLLEEDNEIVSHRAHLGDLTEVEARSLLRDVMGNAASDHDVDAVLETAGFHPLYLLEIARSRAEAAPPADQPFGSEPILPGSLKDILTSKTSVLSEAARSMYALLAIGSGRMRLGDLSALTGESVDQVVEVSEELREAGIIEGERDRIWITHDLFRSAIYQELSEARRALLHHRMALFLRDREDPPVDELATHLDRAGDAEGASTYGWLAGERCLARGTVAEAAHFYELTARNEADPTRVADATARQGVAHHLGRDMARAAPVLELASVKLRAVGDEHRARRLDIRRVEALAEGGRAESADLIARLRMIKEEAEHKEDWEAVALALDGELKTSLLTEDLDRVQDIASELESLKERGTDYAQAALNGALSVALTPISTERAERAAREALKHTRRGAWSRFVAMNRLLMVLLRRGRLFSGDGPAILAEAESMAEASGDLQQRHSFEANRALGYMDAGLFEVAEEGFDKAAELIGSAEMTFARANLACNRGTLEILRGYPDRAAAHFELARAFKGPEVPRYVSDAVNAGLGICALEKGSMSEALRRESALRSEPAIWYYDPSLTMEFRSRLLSRRGESAAAIELLEQTAKAVEGRFVAAWLKLILSQATLMARAGHPELAAVASKGASVATECRMMLRARAFERLLTKAR